MQMTEKQAWEFLAKTWREALQRNEFSPRIFINGIACFGLCHGMGALYFGFGDTISGETYDAMSVKLLNHGHKCEYGVGGYYWPTSQEGGQERIKFCLDQAAKLEEKTCS